MTLTVYTEGFSLGELNDGNVFEAWFPPWFTDWKAKHEHTPDAHGRERRLNRRQRVYDFRRDCVRFSHKIAALTHDSGQDGVLIWLDADTITHADVTIDWLMKFLPGDHYMSWLDRQGTYPECGFMMFDREHPAHDQFMSLVAETYSTDAVFTMKETHDSYVMQQLVKRAVQAGLFTEPFSISGRHRNAHHVFVRTELGACLDHLKGVRKSTGRTPTHEARQWRKEAYWR